MTRWLSCFLLLVACGPTPPPPPDPPPGPGPATCEGACERLRVLGCQEARPTPEGGSCEDVCLNVMSSGIISWDLACRASIARCDQVDSCEAN